MSVIRKLGHPAVEARRDLELVRIVQGKPKHHKLYEPLDSGIWIRVRIDTVRELDQQYKP